MDGATALSDATPATGAPTAQAGERATPFLAQFLEVKRQHPDKLVLFRMGDFYETFHGDAETASKVLGITLTSRDGREAQRTPMAGIPYHALEEYLPRLIRAGLRVAVCEQVEDPRKAKGLVRREVVRVVTSGTLTEDSLLTAGRSNYLFCLCNEGALLSCAWIDFSTGELFVRHVPRARLMDFLGAIRPDELLLPRSLSLDPLAAEIRAALELKPAALDDWWFTEQFGREQVQKIYGLHNAEGLGFGAGAGAGAPLLKPLGALLKYLEDTQCGARLHLRRVRTLADEETLILDRQTLRNLEIFQNLQDGGEGGTLYACLNETATPMGARRLAQWLAQPLLEGRRLERRHEAVQAFLDLAGRERFIATLSRLRDIERPLGRVRCGRYSARDLKSLGSSLELIPELNAILAESPSLAPARVPEFPELARQIQATLLDELPLTLREGGMVRPGVHGELDGLKSIAGDGHDYLQSLEERLKGELGLPGLKVRQNRVFGFYIEVPKAQSVRVPANFVRRQTLTNAERYIIPELKEHEDRIYGAEERIAAIEMEIAEALRALVLERGEELMEAAGRLADLDVLSTFADSAARHRYTRPEITPEPCSEFEAGRHPVVERGLPAGAFYPNDLRLSADGTRLVLLTGPNMAGKSTFIRQVGIIQIMAQIGSFVPAARARLSLKDRVFTRVGAGDDLRSGRSTFMVEMNETANILHNATPRSLVILDEVGRGTSTLDGVSLAWAITEELAAAAPLALFATHYHELTELAGRLPGVANLQVAVEEDEGRIIFLHRIEPGFADKSYGIHVAKLAGLPERVIRRAADLLRHFESGREGVAAPPPATRVEEPLVLFRMDDAAPLRALRERLEKTDADAITPLQALLLLRELKESLKP